MADPLKTTADPMRTAASPRSIADVVERIGLGAAQGKAAVIGGGVWLADGAELLLIGSVTRAVAEDWLLLPWQRGMIVSIVFVGVCAGNVASGILADAYGRRAPITASYFMVFFFSLLSAVAPGVHFLMAIRLLVGFSFGLGQPSWTALSTEITPADSRILMNAISQALFTIGELYSGFLILCQDPFMVHLDWRALLALGAVPSLLMFFLSFYLLESPLYLALTDDYAGAKRNLQKMALDNGVDISDADLDFQPPAPVRSQEAAVKMSKVFGIIAGENMLFSTFTMIYSTLVLNVFFYGCLYAIPQIITDVDMAQAPAMTLIVGALWEIPGYLVAYLCSVCFDRKPCIMIFFVLAAASLASFNVGGHLEPGTTLGMLLTNLGYMGIKVTIPIGSTCLYQYSAEIYPTVIRGTATALCLAGGRIGAMLAPLLFEECVRIGGDWGVFF